LFLFVDEAFWAGDKSGEGTLKGLVTEPTILIEPKFVNLFQAINRLKILMASNADWVVPATHDERRYFVLDVSDCRHCDREYFDRLYAAIDGAELPAFLEYLMQLDLSDFDHRNPPHTAALNAQKLAGGDSLTKFWLDCLTSGEIIGTGESEWPEDVVKQTLHDAYVSHAHDHGDRHPLSNAILAKKLAELMPGRVLRSGRPMKPAGDILRPHRYILPTLDECRTAFLKAMSINQYAWPEEQADDV
jgi:phage/plasmid-associated DNA primase